MIKIMSAIAGKSQQKQLAFGQVESVEATGASETVAGIEGRVYRITTTDPSGKTETIEAVLTDDPLVVAMSEGYMGAMRAMLGEDIGKFMAALPDDDRGLLRVGDDFRLKAISGEEQPASLFELPAEPVSFAEMMQGLGRTAQE